MLLSLLLFAQVVGQGFDRSLEQLERQQIITPAERRRVQMGSPSSTPSSALVRLCQRGDGAVSRRDHLLLLQLFQGAIKPLTNHLGEQQQGEQHNRSNDRLSVPVAGLAGQPFDGAQSNEQQLIKAGTTAVEPLLEGDTWRSNGMTAIEANAKAQ